MRFALDVQAQRLKTAAPISCSVLNLRSPEKSGDQFTSDWGGMMAQNNQHICTNCYHVGRGKMSGSWLLELLLWLFVIPVGFFYSLARRKHRYGDCPQCKGVKTMIPASTPRGQELLATLQKPALAVAPAIVPNTSSTNLDCAQEGMSSVRFMGWAMVVVLAFGLISIRSQSSRPLDMPINFPSTVNPGSIPAESTILAQRRKDAVAAYRDNPQIVIDEINQILKKKDYQLAVQKLDLLSEVADETLKHLNEKAQAGALKATQQRTRQQQMAQSATQNQSDGAKKSLPPLDMPLSFPSTVDSGSSARQTGTLKTAQNQYANIGKAMSECKSAIAKSVGASGSGMIPDVRNFGSGNEFVFGWSRGSFQLETNFGLIDMSASCDGTLRPLKIMSLSVNGETVILNGRRY